MFYFETYVIFNVTDSLMFVAPRHTGLSTKESAWKAVDDLNLLATGTDDIADHPKFGTCRVIRCVMPSLWDLK